MFKKLKNINGGYGNIIIPTNNYFIDCIDYTCYSVNTEKISSEPNKLVINRRLDWLNPSALIVESDMHIAAKKQVIILA